MTPDHASTGAISLVPYLPERGPAVVEWVRSPEEASAWAALDRLPDAADLQRWHADVDVVPLMLLAGDELVGYGQIWEDREEGEAELARLVVAPARRGQGFGKALTRALADEAHRRGFADVWLRVVPENAAAIRAYVAAGFSRATPEQELEFNAGQPRVYLWLRDTAGD